MSERRFYEVVPEGEVNFGIDEHFIDQWMRRAAPLNAIDPVVQAWTNEGRNPTYHRICQQRLISEWPVLAAAIRELVAALGVGGGNDDEKV